MSNPAIKSSKVTLHSWTLLLPEGTVAACLVHQATVGEEDAVLLTGLEVEPLALGVPLAGVQALVVVPGGGVAEVGAEAIT